MRILNRIAIVAVLALFLAAAFTPAQAACGAALLIATTDSTTGAKTFVNTAIPGWSPNYCFGIPGYAPSMYPGVPPVTPAFDGVFWAFGTGNPAIGLGDDNGLWLASSWSYYYANPSYLIYGAAEIFTSWAGAAVIDGCLFNSGPTTGPDPGQECTCVLLTDQDGATGYYAIAANSTDPGSNSFLTQPGTEPCNNNSGNISLQPIPAPYINNATWNPVTGDVTFNATVSGDPGNYNLDPATCGCGPIGYQVVYAAVPRGNPAPSDRDEAAWTVANLPGGGAQPVTPMGGAVTVEPTCGLVDQDVYLGTLLHFDSGYTASVVSSNSTRAECGTNIAEPFEPRPRVRPGTAPELRSPKRTR